MKKVDDSGFWKIENNPITKAGVYPYLGRQISPKLEPNKIYYVYRPLSELTNPETIESFNVVPMINDHEMIGEGFTPYDKRPAGGILFNPVANDKGLNGDLKIYSDKLKNEIKSGKKELSLGYFCDYELSEGEFNGQRYDAIQRNIRGNHIALVNKGRMGSDVRVYDHAITMDSMDVVIDDIKAKWENIATLDERWITVKPNGDDKKGRHLHPEDGETPADAMKRQWGAEVDKNKKIEIAKQTEKAYLLKKDGVEFWVQKRWYKEDEGELTPAGLKEFERKKEEKEWADNWKKEYETKQKKIKVRGGYTQPEKADYESEKALGYDFIIDFIDAEKTIKHRVFIPKSVIKDGVIPEWIINKKMDEIDAEYSNTNRLGNWEILKNPFEQKKTATKDEEIPLEDGSPKKSGDDGFSQQTGEDEMADKREAIREIMAIAAKPASDFDGGEEEKIETIARLLEKSEYSASESSKADDKAVKDKKAADEEVKEDKAEDKCGKDEDKEDKKEEKAEDAKKAMDELSKEVMARIAERDELVKSVQPLVGSFACDSMTIDEVASYACDKLGLDAKDCDAKAMIRGYIAAQGKQRVFGLDSADKENGIDKASERYLKGE